MIKVGRRRPVVGFGVGAPSDKDVLIVETDDGKELPVGPGRFDGHRARRQGPRAASARRKIVRA